MSMIIGKNVKLQYGENKVVLDGIDFEIESGKMTAILGRNGCGKSTLAKLITALLPLSSGKITINNIEICTQEGLQYVRNHCGIVFQNPDNQFVSPVIEDDIRFGLNNHHIPEAEHAARVKEALDAVDLSGFEKRNISTLSGGQKQRAAAAGILALENDILIFDEANAMLDPEGKAELIRCIEEQRNNGRTIIMITQNIPDAIYADRILLMAEGKIIAEGAPRTVLTDINLMEASGISPLLPVRIYYDLKKEGIVLPFCPMTEEELAEEICSLN